jgi:hypothetical protein
MIKEIKFINNSGRITNNPIGKTKELSFRDIVFKEEYKTRKCRFGQGLTWLRFLPAVNPSVYEWMMPVEIHRDMGGVTFTSPKTLDSNVQSPFDIARMWFQKNNKGALSSRDKNPNGLRLYPQKYGVSWVIEEAAPEGQRLKLFYASLYDGVRGGTTGLGFNVKREADARDNEPGSPTMGQLIHGDITDPKTGRLVKVERAPSEKNEFASYTAGIGKNPAPVEHFLSLLTDEEMDMITPLEKTIYIPSDEEMCDILKRYIGQDFYNQIFGEISPDEREPVGPSKASRQNEATSSRAQTHNEVIEVSKKDQDVVEEVEEDEDEEPVIVSKPTRTKKASGSSVGSNASNASNGSNGEEEKTLYTTREVTALLAKEKEGIAELLRNKDRLSKPHLEIVMDSAQEYGLAD